MRFDYYATSVEDTSKNVISMVSKLGNSLAPCHGLARKFRYEQGFSVEKAGVGTVARIFLGGHGHTNPYAFASSDDTDAFVDVVRSTWPGRHLVTRCDAAQDYGDEGGYERMRRVARSIAKRKRLSFSQYIDELNPDAGRTQYIGSPGSDYRVRIYEKGLEQASKLQVVSLAGNKVKTPLEALSTVLEDGQEIRLRDWTRLELQARPRNEEGKRLAASLEPSAIWGFSDWSKELLESITHIGLARIVLRSRKLPDDEKSLRWMCCQYGPLLVRMARDLGSFDCLGRTIEEILREQRTL